MKQLIMAITTALSLAATGAICLADEYTAGKSEKHEKGHAEGHADALGKPGHAKQVSRTIGVEMSDAMRFRPAQIKVRRGETIKFVLKNTGQVKHEMVLGSMKELREHAALMKKFPAMEHAEPNMVSVAPGETGELVWKFTRTGTFDFACLQPGHFEAGMTGKIAVKR